MKAVVYHHYGSPDQLSLQTVEKPVVGNNDVLVKVHAASINSWDWDLLQGRQLLVRATGGWRKPKHLILGADIAGRVEAVGKNVHYFKHGDAVFGDIASAGFGGLAEYVSVPEKLLAKKSNTMSFEQAAAISQAGLLALQGLRYKGDVLPAQQVLINGAGGGVGTLAVQYAKSRGAEVTCVDRSEKFEALSSLGGDHFINYLKEDYTRNGKSYDVILDVIAHRKIRDYKRALKPGGRFVMIGGSMGGLLLSVMFLGPLISRVSGKRIGLMGYRPNRNDLDTLAVLFEEGKCAPVIDSSYRLEDAAEAFHYFGTGEFKGKIMFDIFRSKDI